MIVCARSMQWYATMANAKHNAKMIGSVVSWNIVFLDFVVLFHAKLIENAGIMTWFQNVTRYKKYVSPNVEMVGLVEDVNRLEIVITEKVIFVCLEIVNIVSTTQNVLKMSLLVKGIPCVYPNGVYP